MSQTKQEVEQVLRKLPEDCTLEDVQYELYVIQKVRRGLEAADNAGISHEEAKQRLQRWLTK
ncbi:MAG TPA: hypothetical protein VHS31_19110 [Tepidisphaeraceae bacterium]|jgi:hypothetical protein|nr:hypothetical protein [Tepidisphaeraceae bacterium]